MSRMPFFHTLGTRIIHRKYAILLVAMIVIAALLIGRVALMRHWSLGTYHFDLGNMHQAVYNTMQGRFLEVTDPNVFHQSNRLGYHFDPILAVFAPIYLLFPYAEVLIIAQVIILVLGAIPLYLLARDVLGHQGYGLALAAMYLTYYPMHATALFDFHAITLATTFLLCMFYAGEKKSWFWMTFWMVLAWMTKENVFLWTGMFGLYHMFVKRNRVVGLAISAVSGVAFVFVMKFLIPSFRLTNAHFAAHYYSSDISQNIRRLLSHASFTYLTKLLLPLSFLPLAAPLIWGLIAPELLINLLSINDNMRMLQYHYTALLTPAFFIATIYALNRFKKYRPLVTELMLIVGMMTCVFMSPIMNSHYNVDPGKLATVRVWQNRLADDSIKVAASGHLSPYFSGRQYFYNFFFDFAYLVQGDTDENIKSRAKHYDKAEYVLILKSEIRDHEMVRYYYNQLTGDSRYTKIADENGIEVYKRR